MRNPNDELLIGGKQYVITQVVYSSERNRSWFYQAVERGFNRRVGIKEVRRDPAGLRIAETEARVIASLSHERIPDVFNFDLAGDSFFLVIEWIEGVSLREYLEANAPVTSRDAYRQAIKIGIELCRVLEAVHKKGYKHRDLKPENIILKSGRPYLIDYGISAVLRQAGEGTERYCAPEQQDARALREPMGPAVDIFALGLVLFELLTGTLPHLRVGKGEWDRPEQASEINALLPAGVDKVLARAISYQSGNRFRQASDLRRELERVLDLNLGVAPPAADFETAAAGTPPDPEPADGPVVGVPLESTAPVSVLRDLYNERFASFGLPRHVAPVLQQARASKEG